MSYHEKEEKVLSVINKKEEEIIAFLQSLVRIPSISGSGSPEKEIQGLVAKRLQDIGCIMDIWEPKIDELKAHPACVKAQRTYKGRPIVVGVLEGSGKGKSMILNGHVDVVTPEPVEAWRHDPWSAEIEDGLLYGRGAADMKGGVTSMIMALASIVESGIKLKGDVIVESVLDEEVGGDGTLACVLRGYRADSAVVTEPTELEVHLAHSGGHVFKISLKGKSAHVGFKFEGTSACEKAIKIINSLGSLEKRRNEMHTHPLFERYLIQVPLNIGIFRSGEWIGTVPEEATLEGVIGYLPGEELKDVEKEMEETVIQTAKRDEWMRSNMPVLKWSDFLIEPSEISIEHPIVQTFANSFRKVVGKTATKTGFPAGCDMRLLVKYANTPTIIFGPGSLRQGHTVDEYLGLDQLIMSTKIIALSLLRWCELHE